MRIITIEEGENEHWKTLELHGPGIIAVIKVLTREDLVKVKNLMLVGINLKDKEEDGTRN